LGREALVREIAFSPDGRTLMSASADGTIRLWSVEHCREYGVLFGGTSNRNFQCCFSFSADGRHFAIGYQDENETPVVLLWHKRPIKRD
jgi:WD40 repeat protein